MENKKPIVTVCIITYKSSETIIELLNSILSQGYGANNIELVISDDNSPDNTVSVINNWLIEHRVSFFDVKLNINSKNLGISKNFETVLSLLSSDYIKTIAGDDILKTNALEAYMKFISKSNTNIVFSRAEAFTYKNKIKKVEGIYSPLLESIHSFNLLPAKTQFERIFLKEKEISLSNFDFILPAPTMFFKKDILRFVINSPKGKNCEDYPILLFLTGAKGEQIKISTDILVEYRIEEGISWNYRKTLQNKINNLKDNIFIKKHFVRYLSLNKRIKVYMSIVNLYRKFCMYKIKVFLKEGI